MNIHKFIGGSSLLLTAWLLATFFQKVPSHRYPQLGKDRKNPTALIEESRLSFIASHQDSSPATAPH